MFCAYIKLPMFGFVILVAINGVYGENSVLPNATVCGYYYYPELIAGGVQANEYDYPWLAVLLHRDSNSYECAGSLINEQYVLTAAHCLSNVDKVRLGVYSLSNDTNTVTVSVESIIPHPGYNSNNTNATNDIGLIRLSEIVNYTAYIGPICLPSTDGLQPVNESTTYFIGGWGSNGKHIIDLKQSLRVEISNFTDCKKKWSRYNRHLSEKQLCAADTLRKGTCDGDSGSPLMSLVSKTGTIQTKKLKIEGIASIGSSRITCAAGNWPGVFTRVSSFEEWIKTNIHR